MSIIEHNARITTLENGLQIITEVRPQHPVAAVQVWCRTGSIHEDNWMGAGLSHVLEHMLFKGTEKRPPGQIDKEVQDAGGNMNAYTSFDHTVYYINVPKEGTQLAVDILCDISINASLPEDELESEKDVILREMDMLRDDPGRRSSRRLFETAFHVSPLKYPIIGLPDIYNQVCRQDVVDYYKSKYVPNNLFFVIVGDIDEPAVIEQIEKLFSESRAQSLPPVYIPEEPRQMSSRHIVEEGPFQLGHLHMAFHTPGLSHQDHIPLEVLTSILGQGRSSRLNKELRDKQGLVHSVSSWHYCPGEQGLMAASAIIDGDKLEQTKEGILKLLDPSVSGHVSEEELQKAIKLQKTGILSSLKSVQGVAEDLGSSWFISGDLNYSNTYIRSLESITRQDIQRAAEEWLDVEKSTFYALLPKSPTDTKKNSQTSSQRSEVEKHKLSNGLTVLLCQDDSLPFIETRWATKAGVLMETPANQGISSLTSKVLGKGTATMSREDLADLYESAGGSLDPFSGNNTIGASMECLKDDWHKLMPVMIDCMTQPKIASEVFEIEKQTQLAGIKAQEDQLIQLAFKSIFKQLFGDQGYGLEAQGTLNSVGNIGLQDVLSFHNKWMHPDSSVLAVYGDIQSSSIKENLESMMKSWFGNSECDYPAFNANKFEKSFTGYKKVDKTQSVVALGYQGVTMHDNSKFALDVLQEIYSDLGSRIFTRIRDELGLAYYVGAYHLTGVHPGLFAFYAGTSPDNSDKVADEFLAEIHRLLQSGITDDELERAKAKILGQKKIGAQNLGSLAMAAALDELYNLGFDNYHKEIESYRSVSHKDVKEAADTIFSGKPYALSIVSPEAPGREHTAIDYT